MKAEGYEEGAPLELPTLSTRAMNEGDEVIVRFEDVDIEEKTSKEGGKLQVAVVTDFLDNVQKTMVLPSAVYKHFSALRGKVAKLRKGAQKAAGKYRHWDVIIMVPKGAKARK